MLKTPFKTTLTCLLMLATPTLLVATTANAESETQLTQMWCDKHGGQTEVRYYFKVGKKKKYIKVDCVTETHVIEAGLDKRSSLDSIQQAVFASHLSDKQPAVLIFDAKKGEQAIEYRIRTATALLNIKYIWVVQW